jgi:hypothetical protein
MKQVVDLVHDVSFQKMEFHHKPNEPYCDKNLFRNVDNTQEGV